MTFKLVDNPNPPHNVYTNQSHVVTSAPPLLPTPANIPQPAAPQQQPQPQQFQPQQPQQQQQQPQQQQQEHSEQY